MIPRRSSLPIPADLALRASGELAAAADVELSSRRAEREAVLLAMAAVHASTAPAGRSNTPASTYP